MDRYKAYKITLTKLFDQYSSRGIPLLTKMVYFKNGVKNNLFYGQVFPIIDRSTPKPRFFDYDECIYLEDVVQPEKIKNFTENLWPESVIFRDGITSECYIKLGGIKLISPVQPFISRFSASLSGYKDLGFSSQFPLIYSIDLSSEKALLSQYALKTKDPDMLFYPQLDKLILHKFGFNMSLHSAFKGSLHIPAYSLKGYISELTKKNKKPIVNIEKFVNQKLILKIFAECNPVGFHVKNYPVLGGKNKITLPKNISHISAVLVDIDGEIIDEKTFDFTLSIEKKYIQELIQSGENLTVDFKEWKSEISKKLKEERRVKYSKLLAAFANAEGGHILIGVTDEGKIVGNEEPLLDKIDQFLQNINSKMIRPPIKLTCSEVEVENKKIIMVKVEPSPIKVLNMYTDKYHMRRGSTNGILQPEER